MLDLTHAPCFSRPELAPAEEPPTARLAREAFGQALAVCGPCPLRAECIADVRPQKVGFTGVCGARLWFDGQVIAELDDADPSELPPPTFRKACGTAAGARAHRRAVEQQCGQCAPFHTRYLESLSAAPLLVGGEQLALPV